MFTLISPGTAKFLAFISTFGIIILLGLGVLFDMEVSNFTESIKDPDDPHAVARGCYSAAGIYALLLSVSICQIAVGREDRGRGEYRPVSQ
jgi:ribonuclease kappa